MANSWHYTADRKSLVREGFHGKVTFLTGAATNFYLLKMPPYFSFLVSAIRVHFWHIILLQQYFPPNAATVNFCSRLLPHCFWRLNRATITCCWYTL
jgi:hypothetical protein